MNSFVSPVLRFDKSSVNISCEASSNPSSNVSHVNLRAISANVNSNVISNNLLLSCQNSADSSFSSTISDITSESQQPNLPSQKPLSENTFRVLSSNVDCLTNKLLESGVLLREEAADIASFVDCYRNIVFWRLLKHPYRSRDINYLATWSTQIVEEELVFM